MSDQDPLWFVVGYMLSQKKEKPFYCPTVEQVEQWEQAKSPEQIRREQERMEWEEQTWQFARVLFAILIGMFALAFIVICLASIFGPFREM